MLPICTAIHRHHCRRSARIRRLHHARWVGDQHLRTCRVPRATPGQLRGSRFASYVAGGGTLRILHRHHDDGCSTESRGVVYRPHDVESAQVVLRSRHGRVDQRPGSLRPSRSRGGHHRNIMGAQLLVGSLGARRDHCRHVVAGCQCRRRTLHRHLRHLARPSDSRCGQRRGESTSCRSCGWSHVPP